MRKIFTSNKYKLLLTICVMATALVLMFTILYAFSSLISSNQAKLGRERLREITIQSTSFVRLTVNKEIRLMDAVAQELSKLDDVKSDEAIALLNRFSIGSDFQRLAVDFASGISYTSDGYTVDTSDLDYIHKINKGQTFVTDLIAAKIDGKLCVSIISPIKKDGKVIAAARGTIYTEDFGKMLEGDIFSKEGYFHLLNSKGEYLAVSENKNSLLMDNNYFDALEKLSYDKGYSAKKIKSDMSQGFPGNSAYSYGEEERYLEYMPIGIADWFMMVMVPKEVIDANGDVIKNDMYTVTLILAAIYLGILLFFFYMMKRSTNRIKKMNAELLAGENRYLVLLERSDKVVFEYCFSTGSIEYSEKFIDVFGYKPTVEGIPDSIIESGEIHHEDAEKIKYIFEMVKKGEPSSSAELRIRGANGGYLWCYVMLATIFSENGIPVRALGIIENIEEQKQRELALLLKAEKDQLTGLYNKTTTEKLIKEFLSDPSDLTGKHALLIIDIDDFKFVNDNFGHLYGDVVLATLATCLLQISNENDVMGRIGGDEFFVFMKNIAKDNEAVLKAEKICELFRRTYSENNICCHISASIGIAIFPKDGKAFEDLYKNADSALYIAKAEGKDSCNVYDATREQAYHSFHRTAIEHSQMPIKNDFDQEDPQDL